MDCSGYLGFVGAEYLEFGCNTATTNGGTLCKDGYGYSQRVYGGLLCGMKRITSRSMMWSVRKHFFFNARGSIQATFIPLLLRYEIFTFARYCRQPLNQTEQRTMRELCQLGVLDSS